ncbi:MAG TPA: FHA domain-containing protein [Myxococcota bacterium]|nr:FHA domain-containing protein [Myxococcota bacterium]HSA21865.1 FHA domain-containing protein [Myxococcota bacterium]
MEDAISDDDIIEELDDEPAEDAISDGDILEELDDEPGDDAQEQSTGRHLLPPEGAPAAGSQPEASLDAVEPPPDLDAIQCPVTQEVESPLPSEETTDPRSAAAVREQTAPQRPAPAWDEATNQGTPKGARTAAPEPEPEPEPEAAPEDGDLDRLAAALPRRRATMPLAGPPLGGLARDAGPEPVSADPLMPEDLSDEPEPEPRSETVPEPEPEAEPEPEPESESESEAEAALAPGEDFEPTPEPEPVTHRPARSRRRRPAPAGPAASAGDEAESEPEVEPADEAVASPAPLDPDFNAEPKPLAGSGQAPRHKAAGGRSWAEEPEKESPADEVAAFAQATSGLNEATRVEPFNPDPPPASEKTLIFGQGDQEGAPEPAYLVIVSGDEEGREVEITRPEITLGRGPDNDLVFPDIACSRRHAKIVQEGDEYFVEDMGSGNGTLLNGKKIKRARLEEGDRVEIGNTAVEFHLPPAAASAGRDDAEADESDEVDEADAAPRAHGRTTITGAVLPESAGTAGPLARLLADPRRRRLVVVGGGALVGLIVIMMIVRLFMPTPPREPTPEELERKARMEAKRQLDLHMDDAKAAVQAKKWREALAAVQAAEEIDPEHPMVVSYKSNIQLEMSSASAMSMARMHMESKEWDKAMGALQGVSMESELKEQAAALKKELDAHLLDDMLLQGQKMMEAKQYNQAILKFDEVLRHSPGNEEALVAKRMAEEAVDKEQRRPPVNSGGKRRRRVTNPEPRPGAGLTGQALALYKNGEVDRAIDKAENGGASGEELSRLRQFQTAYSKAMEAAKNSGQPGQAVDALLKAYALDKKIAGGQGEYRRILSEKLAKAYMVKGVDAHTGRRLPEAYKAYRSALQYDSSLPKVKERLEDLKREAKKLYEEAYVIKSTNQDVAIGKLKTAIQIVPPDEIYYGKAKKLLNSLQGEADGAPDSGGEGF